MKSNKSNLNDIPITLLMVRQSIRLKRSGNVDGYGNTKDVI